MELSQLPLRQELIGQQPYGAPQIDVPAPLNVNENPYPPSLGLRKDMARAIEEQAASLNRYPDREATKLRAALAKYLGHQLEVENIWAANGSNEIMVHLLDAFGGPQRKLLTFTPTYSMYPQYARTTHTQYLTYPRYDDFSLDAKLVLAAATESGADILLITTPNNPTGTLTPLTEIAKICQGFDGIVIVDEAYQEFSQTPDETALKLLPQFPKLVVSRTLSKAFALAGARLGYLAADKAIVDACRIVRLPYHLSGPTQTIALTALNNAPAMLEKVDQLRKRCQETQIWLEEQGLQVVPSQSNFCLFGKFQDRHKVWQALLEQGVLVREVGPEGFLRVCAGTAEQMQLFRKAIIKVLADAN